MDNRVGLYRAGQRGQPL